MTKRIVLAGLLFAAGYAASRPAYGGPAVRRMHWDRGTLRYAAAGGYPRIARLKNGDLLLTCERRGQSFASRSSDAGRTWTTPVVAATSPVGSASNPQPLVLADGTVWLFYNERPRDGRHPFTIRLAVSTDDGRTWTPREQPLYSAGTKFGDGCWEPAAVRRANGDIDLFFANEGPYRDSDEQQITRLRTSDAGKTWSPPRAVSFRKKHRDGMPVPLELAGGRGLVVAIEDNGLTADNRFKPAIVRLDTDTDKLPVDGNDARRGSAVAGDWTPGIYAGAPYLCQLPDGTTLLSCQSDENAKSPRMAVYAGDADAKHFAGPTFPFPVDAGKAGEWNSLFVKDDGAVVAASSTTIDGKRGVWLIDGVFR